MILSRYSMIMDLLVKVIKVFLAICLSIMTAVTVLEVVRRYIFGLSYPWAEELVRFMLIWVTFVGGAAAFRTANLVILDLGLQFLSEKQRHILKLFTNTVVLVLLIYVFSNCFSYTTSPVITKQVSTGLGVPMTVPYSAMPIGFGLMILFSLEVYGNTMRELRKD
jgi:TRAP-type C4-dicarboxylate transport system permease small subunit